MKHKFTKSVCLALVLTLVIVQLGVFGASASSSAKGLSFHWFREICSGQAVIAALCIGSFANSSKNI